MSRLEGVRNVIVVTDGDMIAKAAVEIAAKNVGGRCISVSGGNPTKLDARMMAEQISKAENDPVLVMVDDRGKIGEGKGEHVLKKIAENPDINILGVIAVASNTCEKKGTKVDVSITNDGRVVNNSVDKNGNEIHSNVLKGDTVSVIDKLEIPVIIGLGDPGKMDFQDGLNAGAPITTKAVREVLIRSGYWEKSQ